MSERNKRIAILAGIVIAILFLILLRRGSNSAVVSQSGDVNTGDVYLPGLFIPPGTPVIIPNFGAPDSMSFSAIGACCSDCSKSQGRSSYLPAQGSTFVYNQGNRGPTIYYYEPPAPVKRRSGAVASWSSG